MTAEIRSLIIQRNFHHKKAQKSGSSNEWHIYRTHRNSVTTRIREAKRHYYTNLIEDNENDCGKLWKAIKSVTSTNVTASQVESLIFDGEDVLEPEVVSAKFGSFFKTAIGNLRQALPRTLPSLTEPQLTNPHLDQTFRLTSISGDFVYKQLKTIKNKKSTGFSDIPARLLKDGAETLAKPLALLVNSTTAEETIPAEWKHAVVTPIHKSGPKTDPANFRPISVLPVFSKTLERAIHNGLRLRTGQEDIL